MKADLAGFLASRTPLTQETVTWGGGLLPLRVTSYVGDQRPPLEHVTSVRAVIFRNDTVLVVRNPNGAHIVPGGRRERNETLEETLRREVLEETGWTIGEASMLGFTHFHHLSPELSDYQFIYPDILQLI